MVEAADVKEETHFSKKGVVCTFKWQRISKIKHSHGGRRWPVAEGWKQA